jgi:hypothetical protein
MSAGSKQHDGAATDNDNSSLRAALTTLQARLPAVDGDSNAEEARLIVSLLGYCVRVGQLVDHG